MGLVMPHFTTSLAGFAKTRFVLRLAECGWGAGTASPSCPALWTMKIYAHLIAEEAGENPVWLGVSALCRIEISPS